MKILVADDDPISRCLVTTFLRKWGQEVLEVTDGLEAWKVMQEPERPALAILDWMMPGLDGPDVCRRIRQQEERGPAYILVLTAKGEKADAVAALDAGADDFVSKPFNPAELRARIQTGIRVMTLQQTLADRVHDLEDALRQVQQLQGLLPICAWCKRVRNLQDDQQYWQSLEEYFTAHSDLRFTHGICPTCLSRIRDTEIAKSGGREIE